MCLEEPGQDLTNASLTVPAAHRLVMWSYTLMLRGHIHLRHSVV